jgi:hypothetical protein
LIDCRLGLPCGQTLKPENHKAFAASDLRIIGHARQVLAQFNTTAAPHSARVRSLNRSVPALDAITDESLWFFVCNRQKVLDTYEPRS